MYLHISHLHSTDHGNPSEEPSFFDSTLVTCSEPEIPYSFEALLTLAIFGGAVCAPSQVSGTLISTPLGSEHSGVPSVTEYFRLLCRYGGFPSTLIFSW